MRQVRSLRGMAAGMAFGLVLVLALGTGALAQGTPPLISSPTPRPTATPTPLTVPQALALTPEAFRKGGLTYMPLVPNVGGVRILNVPFESFSYTVEQDDTLWSLALDFGRDLDTMSCTTIPVGPNADKLIPGQVITIPGLNDLCYTVRPGDTLTGIAARHRLKVETIAAVAWNGFTSAPYRVRPQQRILLPGARPLGSPRPEHSAVSFASDAWSHTPYRDWPFGDGKFIWPVEGWISQIFHPGHLALDIATPIGTPVKAVDRGRVIRAGWSPVGYGFRVVIDHGIDYVTLYAHLSDIYVKEGEIVGKGQVIGASGSNGNITGPHLHFEIRDFGYLTDPLTLLPKR